MITVHHLNNSRSQRVLWLLEELDLPYEVVRYQRRASMAAPPELKRIHPLGKSPVIEDRSDEERIILVETGAICEYLVGKAHRLGEPTAPTNKILYRQFLHYAEGSVMPLLFALLVAGKIPLLGRIAVNRLQPMLNVHLDFIEDELTDRGWFAGDSLSAADVMMSFPLEAASARGLLGHTHPAIRRWLQTIHDRPAYHRALEKGGSYDFTD